jgi:hypothetical protein
MFHFFDRVKVRLAKRGISLFLAYLLLLQSLFVSLLATKHALAAATPELAFVLCTSHDGAGTSPARPAAPARHHIPCSICLAAAAGHVLLPLPPDLPNDFVSRTIAAVFAPEVALLPQPHSPRTSQGPPLNV